LERTKGGRVRGRAGALMNQDLCERVLDEWKPAGLRGSIASAGSIWRVLGMEEAPPDGERWLCDDCNERSHVCRICGQRDKDDYAGEIGVRCCSVPRCGLFYHLSCVRQDPLTIFYSRAATSSFKCLLTIVTAVSAHAEVAYYVHCLAANAAYM